MRQSFTVLSILGLLSAACGQSANPLSPGPNEGSLRRIVDDVSGGNVGVCSVHVCVELQGHVELTSPAGTLTRAYQGGPTALGLQNRLQPRDFDVSASVMTATGRLADLGLVLFFLEVSPQSATVTINLNGPNDTYVLAQGPATPVFSVTADATCTSGQRIETTMTLRPRTPGPDADRG